ncbi:hypothetical protein HK099_003694, partial [Clydaea vesicula]
TVILKVITVIICIASLVSNYWLTASSRNNTRLEFHSLLRTVTVNLTLLLPAFAAVVEIICQTKLLSTVKPGKEKRIIVILYVIFLSTYGVGITFFLLGNIFLTGDIAYLLTKTAECTVAIVAWTTFELLYLFTPKSRKSYKKSSMKESNLKEKKPVTVLSEVECTEEGSF